MKALTLHEPWATAMALGIKSIETRGWVTRHRGLLAIHAGAGKHKYAREFWASLTAEDLAVFAAAGYDSYDALPFGRVVAIGRLANHQTTEYLRSRISARELRWGNYAPWRYGWPFVLHLRLPEPIAAKGKQQLWNWDTPADLSV